ncbi:hypothetical protein LEMLEM_LOCUS26722, partial [Lemmus lemmus]
SARRWAPAPAAPTGHAIPWSPPSGLARPSFPPWNRPFPSVRLLRPSLSCGDNPGMESKTRLWLSFSGRGSQVKTTKNDRRAVSLVTQVCREERAGGCAGGEHRFRCARSGGATSFVDTFQLGMVTYAFTYSYLRG